MKAALEFIKNAPIFTLIEMENQYYRKTGKEAMSGSAYTHGFQMWVYENKIAKK